jgi:hypothetical protein
MGYRSEVAMAIYGEPEAMNDIISYFDEEFEKLSDETKEYLKHGINITDNKIIIHYDSIKWYEYEDFFKRIWHYANFESDGINGEYIIIGEALDDVEEESFGDSPVWILSLNRSISINTGDDKS